MPKKNWLDFLQTEIIRLGLENKWYKDEIRDLKLVISTERVQLNRYKAYCDQANNTLKVYSGLNDGMIRAIAVDSLSDSYVDSLDWLKRQEIENKMWVNMIELKVELRLAIEEAVEKFFETALETA